MKNIKSQIILLITLVSVFCLFSCSPSLSVKIASIDKVSVDFSSGLGDNLVQTLYSITDTDSQSPLFNKTAVFENLESAGFSVESVIVDNNNLSLKTKPVALEKIVGSTSGLIEEVTSNSVKFSLTPEKFQDFVSVLPEETIGYLDLLCAPILTNEELSPDDYSEVLAAIYGKKIAQETLDSNFVIEFSVPENSNIKEIKVKIPNSKTVTNKNKARITVPLADFLCNLEESQISIIW